MHLKILKDKKAILDLKARKVRKAQAELLDQLGQPAKLGRPDLPAPLAQSVLRARLAQSVPPDPLGPPAPKGRKAPAEAPDHKVLLAPSAQRAQLAHWALRAKPAPPAPLDLLVPPVPKAPPALLGRREREHPMAFNSPIRI